MSKRKPYVLLVPGLSAQHLRFADHPFARWAVLDSDFISYTETPGGLIFHRFQGLEDQPNHEASELAGKPIYGRAFVTEEHYRTLEKLPARYIHNHVVHDVVDGPWAAIRALAEPECHRRRGKTYLVLPQVEAFLVWPLNMLASQELKFEVYGPVVAFDSLLPYELPEVDGMALLLRNRVRKVERPRSPAHLMELLGIEDIQWTDYGGIRVHHEPPETAQPWLNQKASDLVGHNVWGPAAVDAEHLPELGLER